MSDSDNSSTASDAGKSKIESKKRAASVDAPGINKYDDGNGFTDETLQCRDCEKDFIFTAEDQAFHASKGFENKPVRCADCRNSKKQRLDSGGRGRGGRGGGRFGGDRACYNCGGSGHMSRDCPEPRKEGGGRGYGAGGGDRACYNCGGSGHMSRDCPEPRKESGGRGRGPGRGSGGGRGYGGFGNTRDRY